MVTVLKMVSHLMFDDNIGQRKKYKLVMDVVTTKVQKQKCVTFQVHKYTNLF